MGKEVNLRGQVTIFIIVAILIIVAIIAALFFFGKIDLQFKEDLTPRQFIDKCVREAVEPSVAGVLAGGGRIDPSLFKMYRDEKYNYLCYHRGYYSPCVNHYPQLKEIVEDEIIADSVARVEECFESFKADSEKKGFSFTEESLEYDIELAPGLVLIKVNKKIDISRGDNAQSFSEFDSRILSPLYDLVYVAVEIVSQESRFCNFEYNGFMLLYPAYDIKRISYDESKIYHVVDRNSDILFKFAVRSCALPPGV